MAAVGIVVGLVPVTIGMLWFPFVRTLAPVTLHIVLTISAGIRAYVGVEMGREVVDYAVETAFDLNAAGRRSEDPWGSRPSSTSISTWNRPPKRSSRSRSTTSS